MNKPYLFIFDWKKPIFFKFVRKKISILKILVAHNQYFNIARKWPQKKLIFYFSTIHLSGTSYSKWLLRNEQFCIQTISDCSSKKKRFNCFSLIVFCLNPYFDYFIHFSLFFVFITTTMLYPWIFVLFCFPNS